MKKVVLFISLSLFFTGQPQITSNAQENNIHSFRIYPDNSRKKKQDELFKTAFANQDTLEHLIRIKNKRVKVIYVKVYKTVPIYVPVNSSFADTLTGLYYIDTTIKKEMTPLYKK